MKKFPKYFISLVALINMSGCMIKKTKDFEIPDPIQKHVSNPNLTLIKKQVPRYYSFSFDQAKLYFSTNRTQQTHAILTRYLCPDSIKDFQTAPIGETMKKDEWDKYFRVDKICPGTRAKHFNNWQKFYQ